MLRKILLTLTALGFALAAVAVVVAPNPDVVWAAPSAPPAGARWDAGFSAYVVEIKNMSSVAPSPTYAVPVVEVYRGAGVSAQLTACPTGTASKPNDGRFCAYTSTGFNGSVYMWNWQWKNHCVPVNAPYDNDVESFAVGFPDQHAELNANAFCDINARFQTIGPLSNDSNLSPYNNYLTSYLAY